MSAENIYKFYQYQFKVGEQHYTASITPELYGEEDGLDFTGCYHVLLIGSGTGTRYMFHIPGDNEKQYQVEAGDINTRHDIELLSELCKLIHEIKTSKHDNTSR